MVQPVSRSICFLNVPVVFAQQSGGWRLAAESKSYQKSGASLLRTIPVPVPVPPPAAAKTRRRLARKVGSRGPNTEQGPVPRCSGARAELAPRPASSTYFAVWRRSLPRDATPRHATPRHATLAWMHFAGRTLTFPRISHFSRLHAPLRHAETGKCIWFTVK